MEHLLYTKQITCVSPYNGHARYYYIKVTDKNTDTVEIKSLAMSIEYNRAKTWI